MSKSNTETVGCCGKSYQLHTRNIAIFLVIYTSIELIFLLVLTIWKSLDPSFGIEFSLLPLQFSLVSQWIRVVLTWMASGLLLFGYLRKNRAALMCWCWFTFLQTAWYLCTIIMSLGLIGKDTEEQMALGQVKRY